MVVVLRAVLLQLVVQVLQGVQLAVVMLVQKDLVIQHLTWDLVGQSDSAGQPGRVGLVASR